VQRKLQVFVSSTFTDLKDERQAAVEAILLANHIPAGMELFTAGDTSQLEVIKRWIKESDAYLLILGGRYGSIEPTSGRSYTEVEYDFAVENGLPHFALVLDDNAVASKRELGLITAADDAMRDGALAEFRRKVLSKSSAIVNDAKDLKLQVLASLREIEQRPGLGGWTKASEAADIKPLLGELAALRADNSELRAALSAAPTPPPIQPALDEAVTLRVEAKSDRHGWYASREATTTWRELFKVVGIKLLAARNDQTLQCEIGNFLCSGTSEYVSSIRVRGDDWETVKAQFLHLGLITIEYANTIGGGAALFWSLTPTGRQLALILRAPAATRA